MIPELFRLEKVSFSYSSQSEPVLKKIDLEINKGEFIAVLGSNGSGKSTLAKILGGLIVPLEGSFKFKGRSLTDRDFRQLTGMLFSNPGDQFFAPIVEEDVAFGLENRGIPTSMITDRVHEVLREFNLSKYADREVQTLSAGEQQKTGLAGIVALRPELIILDEPLAYLDLREQQEIMATLERLRQETKTAIIMFTHSLYWGLQTDRFYVLSDHRLSSPYRPDKVLSHLENLEKQGIMIPEIVRLRYLLEKAGIGLPIDTKDFPINPDLQFLFTARKSHAD